MEVSITEAARIRGVSGRRIAQQAKEGGWGVRKVARGRYVLSDHESSNFKHESSDFNHECANLDSPEGRLALEEKLRTELEQTDQFQRRAMLICILAELELDRVISNKRMPEFGNEDRPLNKTELDWLLNSSCFQIGILSSEDLGAMAETLKRGIELLKEIKDCKLSEMTIDDSAWRFIIFNCLMEMLDEREKRGDQRVLVADNTGFIK